MLRNKSSYSDCFRRSSEEVLERRPGPTSARYGCLLINGSVVWCAHVRMVIHEEKDK